MNDSKHLTLSDSVFAERFANLSLPPLWFDHSAHLRLAFILLSQYSREEAEEIMCEQIEAFDQHHGDGTKYHETITRAAVKTIAHFMHRSPYSSFSELISKFPRLLLNFKELLLSHYSEEILANPRSKASFIEPDILPYND